MFRVAICDDEIKIVEELAQTLQEIYGDKLEIICVSAIEDYVVQIKTKKDYLPDIMIMDIQWDRTGSNGIDIAGELQAMYPKLKVIFLTGYIEYASDIFKANPSYFLVKPVERQLLQAAMDKVLDEIISQRNKRIVLYLKGEIVSLSANDIMYVESDKHELLIHGTDDSRSLWMKIDDFLDAAGEHFIKIHQSYAVNAMYIRKIVADKAELTDGTRLPISRRRYAKVKDAFLDYLEIEWEVS